MDAWSPFQRIPRREYARLYPTVSGRLQANPGSAGYLFPNDEQEQDRQDMVHELTRLTMDCKLFFAPVKPKRVLDIGTGTGSWALAMGMDSA